MDPLKISIYEAKDLAKRLFEGSVASFPTDTLPALSALPKHASLLWEIKQRPLNKPLILMGSKAEELLQLVSLKALKDAQKMAKRYWPGALTMVLPAEGDQVQNMNPGSLNIGLRVPGCKVARDLLDLSGPLATTSANLSGSSPLLSAEDVAGCFPSLPILAPIPWPKPAGLASTVVFWQSEGCWKLLREGSVIPEGF